MVGDRLPCGHPNGWMLRLRDGNRLYKYCWGCIIEKTGISEVFDTPAVKKKIESVKATSKKEE